MRVSNKQIKSQTMNTNNWNHGNYFSQGVLEKIEDPTDG
jgi:hypothetical protein